MISILNVTKRFGSFVAIENLSLKIEKGSIYGLVGYNGAGKTTLLKTVAGVYKADGGSVSVDRTDVYNSEELRRKMFYVPDDIYFEPFASIEKMAKFYSGYYPDFSFETLDKRRIRT